MTDNAYLVWFLATAVMVIAVLTVGTLAAAGILTRAPRGEAGAPDAAGTGRPGEQREGTAVRAREHQRAA